MSILLATAFVFIFIVGYGYGYLAGSKAEKGLKDANKQ